MAVNIGAMLLVLISFVALGNMILTGVAGTETLTIESILVCLCTAGVVDWHSLGTGRMAGSLLGTKVVLNEVMAYVQFSASADLFTEHPN